MRVRFYVDLEVDTQEMSEGMDVTIYGNDLVRDMVNSANTCDDLPLRWEEIQKGVNDT